MNSINLTGNICNEIELKSTTTGKSVVTFNLAVKRYRSGISRTGRRIMPWRLNEKWELFN